MGFVISIQIPLISITFLELVYMSVCAGMGSDERGKTIMRGVKTQTRAPSLRRVNGALVGKSLGRSSSEFKLHMPILATQEFRFHPNSFLCRDINPSGPTRVFTDHFTDHFFLFFFV